MENLYPPSSTSDVDDNRMDIDGSIDDHDPITIPVILVPMEEEGGGEGKGKVPQQDIMNNSMFRNSTVANHTTNVPKTPPPTPLPPTSSAATSEDGGGDRDDNDDSGDDGSSSNMMNITTNNNNNQLIKPPLPSHITLKLDIDEMNLFHTLQETVNMLQNGILTIPTRPDVKTATVRVAGGWVRDKILNLHTHDVDIAIDTCTGVEFATLVQEYLKLQHKHEQQEEEEEQHQQQANEMTTTTTTKEEGENDTVPTPNNNKISESSKSSSSLSSSKSSNKKKSKSNTSNSSSRIAVIAANPNQSKHLETATCKINGIEIDFANLRHEAYDDTTSRIPTTTQLGTPYQDAYRRDFTINSLFLNITTMVVEDYTRRGLYDLLYNQKITTPLPSIETFLDDPLRVLRAIRFAVRYNYTLDESLQVAAQNDTIHQALHIKVSRERVGKELLGMLYGKSANPKLAFTLFNKLHLAGSIFLAPSPVSRMLQGGTIGIKYPILYPPIPSERISVTASTTTTATAGAVVSVDGGGGGGTGDNSNPGRSSSRNSDDSCTDDSDISVDEEQERAAAIIRAKIWDESKECLEEVPAILNIFQTQNTSSSIEEGTTTAAAATTAYDEPLVYMAVFLLPYYKLGYEDSKKKNVTKLVVEYMMREGIKFKNKDVQAMVAIMENVTTMCELLRHEPPPPRPQPPASSAVPSPQSASKASPSTSTAMDVDMDSEETEKILLWKQIRLQTGMLLRGTKDLWVSTLVVATVFWIRCQEREEEQYRQQQQTTNQLGSSTTTPMMITISKEQILERARQWHDSILHNLKLDHCWTMKALLNGKEICSKLNVPKGPLVGVYTNQMMEWMLMNPEGTRDECLSYFLSQKQQQHVQEELEESLTRSAAAARRRQQQNHDQHNHQHENHHYKQKTQQQQTQKHVHKKVHLSPPS